MQSGGEVGDDGSAEQHTVFLLRQQNTATGGIGVQSHQQRVAGMTTSQMQRVDTITMAIECINDVACAQRNADGGCIVKPCQ